MSWNDYALAAHERREPCPKPVYKKKRAVKDAPSILMERKVCYFCGDEGDYIPLQKHHVFGGIRRDKSAEFGCWVWICPHHHTGDEGIHWDRARSDELKAECQRAFEEIWGHDRFMVEFGKNYILD